MTRFPSQEKGKKDKKGRVYRALNFCVVFGSFSGVTPRAHRSIASFFALVHASSPRRKKGKKDKKSAPACENHSKSFDRSWDAAPRTIHAAATASPRPALLPRRGGKKGKALPGEKIGELKNMTVEEMLAALIEAKVVNAY